MKINKLKENRNNYFKNETSKIKRVYYSPISFSQYKITIPLITKYAKGKLIDVGCGDLPYKEHIENYVSSYESIDVEKRTPNVTYIGDICNMEMIQDAMYDSAMSLEVLEHVSHPFAALKEINRILKINGIIIISVPHLSRLHEEPTDYFRFTKYGLRSILEETGFEVKIIVSRGGLMCFLGHQLSTVLNSIFYSIPFIRNIAYYFNKLFFVYMPFIIDKYTDKNKRFAAGYTCVAVKKKQ